jgi:hypothetical protein
MGRMIDRCTAATGRMLGKDIAGHNLSVLWMPAVGGPLHANQEQVFQGRRCPVGGNEGLGYGVSLLHLRRA